MDQGITLTLRFMYISSITYAYNSLEKIGKKYKLLLVLGMEHKYVHMLKNISSKYKKKMNQQKIMIIGNKLRSHLPKIFKQIYKFQYHLLSNLIIHFT
jgi:hypothetical protein